MERLFYLSILNLRSRCRELRPSDGVDSGAGNVDRQEKFQAGWGLMAANVHDAGRIGHKTDKGFLSGFGQCG